MKVPCMVLAVGVCLSAGASADVIVGYDANTDDPNTAELEVEPGSNSILIGLSSTSDSFVTSVIVFEFEEPDGVTLTDFAWDAFFDFDNGSWFVSDLLPDPTVAAPVGGYPVLATPANSIIATLTIDIDPAPFGTLLTLPTGIEVADLNSGQFLPLTPGSDSVTLLVVPEPDTFALLALAIIAIHRERVRLR